MEYRTFIPGSEWVYFKLYTGTKTSDTILKNEIHKYIKEMMKNDFIDRWFFIRYNDPDFHIRLRLHLKDAHNFTCIFNRFFEIFSPSVNSGFIWNIQCDTYQREIERYGSNSISYIEEFFFVDSESLIELLYSLSEENSEQERWKQALILIDSFLSAFSVALLQRKELLSTLAESYKKEFGYTRRHNTKQLNDKYRFYRKDIENIMLLENENSEAIYIIKARRQAIIPIAERLIGLNQSDELQITMKSLLSSMIHMTMNRWFSSKNRLHEMVIYEFLSRFYTSEIAKNKANPNSRV